ncbi:MAG: ComEC/Rec2 family competence protein [Candidatus Hodarchaeales archaeon]|jgi:competence protein ComEC
MRENDNLKLHFLNVNHGDATIIEFPDYGVPRRAHFAVVDFGAKSAEDRGVARDYMTALIEVRRGTDAALDYEIDFVCVTHPHDDHYGGLKRFMDVHSGSVAAFWDCGFRTNSIRYIEALRDVVNNDRMTFVRVAAGAEFEFGNVRVTVLAPSVDLRNRFDTYGVDKNNSSVVLKVKFQDSYIIIAGDAEFASWAKSTEEFPRMERVTYMEDALGLAERDETEDQLACNLLRMSHHGSKHGSSLEYLERLHPSWIVVSAGSDQWYIDNEPDWRGRFPHPLVLQTLDVLERGWGGPNIQDIIVTGDSGHVIVTYEGGDDPSVLQRFVVTPNTNLGTELAAHW